MSPRLDIDALSPTELKSLVLKLLEEAAENQRTIGALRDELARLKGAPGRPDIKPSVKSHDPLMSLRYQLEIYLESVRG